MSGSAHSVLVHAVTVAALSTLSLLSIERGVSAQEFRATITGRVTDPNGLAVPGATVTAVNNQTREIAVGATTADGDYSIPFLKPGLYSVSAELSGFKKVTHPNVQLEVGQTAAVNFQLTLGEVTEEISVTAAL